MKRLEARIIRLEDYLKPRYRSYEVWIGDDVLLGPDGAEVLAEAIEERAGEVVDIGGSLERPSVSQRGW